ncbi:hypothetical protein BGZ54_007807 [Gamsiella multidivaricata]|nr:hypothetical protein BGZ54_007807 [Gamsiella multidivaricata]
MDTSPKHSCHQDHVSVFHERGAMDPHVDYIQIWLNAHPSVEPAQGTVPTSVPDTTSVIASESMPQLPFTPQEQPAPQSTSDLEADDSMEWVSCQSSPMSHSVPQLDEQYRSPSPDLFEEYRPLQHASVSPSTPIALAFQQYVMLPHLPYRNRARCIFLAPRSSANNRMHRRVRDLLHNTSVQRIRNWFKTTVEPCALEQQRNLSLLNFMSKQAAAAEEGSISCAGEDSSIIPDQDACPICLKASTAMKVITTCGHSICWKCEQDLDRAGNISCPMCRRMRLVTTYRNVLDLFKTTIGLHQSDYTHPYCLSPDSQPRFLGQAVLAAQTKVEDEEGEEEEEEEEYDAEIEHELAERYLWEQSASFLEYLQSAAKHHPANQYFQLNAARDLCFKPSTEHHLPEYFDQAPLEPPTSGLILPPHRLYVTVIHVCLDMLTLPNPTEFQQRAQFKREAMLIELVALFLVPTDEFSPRELERIYNAPAWIEHGQYVLARIHRFLQAKVRQNIMKELDGDEPLQAGQRGARLVNTAVPSTPISRGILYMGTARWTWVAQSLLVLITWIQVANGNPSMVAPITIRSGRSLLGKHMLQEETFRPSKRRLIE